MTVLGMNAFAFVVVFLAGVVTGALVVFFVRGPLVAYFRLRDEPVEPVYVEVMSPQPTGRRGRRQAPWERVAVRVSPYSPLPQHRATRAELARGHDGGAA